MKRTHLVFLDPTEMRLFAQKVNSDVRERRVGVDLRPHKARLDWRKAPLLGFASSTLPTASSGLARGSVLNLQGVERRHGHDVVATVDEMGFAGHRTAEIRQEVQGRAGHLVEMRCSTQGSV